MQLESISEHHHLADFTSGNADLDDWLKSHARQANEMDSARTFVLVEADQVVGYFSLTMGSVRKEDAPKKLVGGLPGYPVGMVLLARLSVDAKVHGRGVGAGLLSSAVRKALLAAEVAAARLVVVDAIDDAAVTFYEHFDFRRTPEQPRRLYRRTKDIRAAYDAAEARRDRDLRRTRQA